MTSEIIEALGLAAGTITTISFLPQVLKVVRDRQTADISLGMYALFTFGVFLWLVYGLLLGRPAIFIANAITLVLAGIILLMKIKHG